MSKTSLTPLEQYVIDRVREMRIVKDMSVRDLAHEMDMSFGFIGNIENPKHRAKYKLEHLNKLAEIFDCSPKDFLPEKRL